MKKSKQLISVMLLCVFVAVLLPTFQFAKAASAPYLYQFFSFENDSVGDIPIGVNVNIKGEANIISVENDPLGNGKCMMISRNDVSGDTYADMPLKGADAVSNVYKLSLYCTDTTSEKLLTIRTTVATFHDILRFCDDGTLKSNNTVIGRYEANQWYKIIAVLNNSTNTMDLYLNGANVVKGCKYSSWGTKTPMVSRVQFVANKQTGIAGAGTVYVDDCCFYGGDDITIEDYNAFRRPAVKLITPESTVRSTLTDSVALLTESRTAFANGEKTQSPCSPKLIDSKLYVPAEFVAKALGATVTAGASELSIAKEDFTVSYTENSTTALTNDGLYTMSAPMLASDGVLLLPVSEFTAQLFGAQQSYHTKYGVVILDCAKKNLTDAQVKDVFDYLTYTRPTAEQILRDFAPKMNVHPRIMATAEDFDRIKEEMDTDLSVFSWYNSVISTSENMLVQEHTYYYKSDGLRLLPMSRQLLTRAYTLSMAYKLSGDARYADYLWGELDAVCSFADWNSANHFLDTAEMTTGVSIAYDWCYEYWTDAQKGKIENAIYTLGLIPGTNAFYDESGVSKFWVTIQNNWNEVCNGGLSIGALALMDKYPTVCSNLMEMNFKSMEYMLGEFAPDGAWPEGVSYWQYCTSYFAYHMAALDSALGTDYGYFNVAGIDNTAYFITYAQSAQGGFNFHDAGEGKINSSEMFYFAKKLSDGNISKIRLNAMKNYGMSAGALDLLWYDSSIVATTVDLKRDAYFRDTEMATFRSAFDDSSALFAGIHGGYNSMTHGNLDSGTFVLDALGTRWVSQLGGDDYNMTGYFNMTGGRWQYYRCNSQGQNTISLNPVSEYGQEPSATTVVQSFVSEDRGGYAILDMTEAFGDKVSSAKRGIMVDENRTQVCLQDELNLTKSSDFWWFAHTKTTPELVENGKAVILTSGTKKLYVALSCNRSDAKFEIMDAQPVPGSVNPDCQNKNTGIKKLAIHIPNAVGTVTVSVRFIPIYSFIDINSLSASNMQTLPLNSWTMDQSEAAGATSLLCDNSAISGFSKDISSYTVRTPSDNKTVPKVAAVTKVGFQSEVTQATAIGKTACVKVFETTNPKNVYYYYVTFSAKTSVKLSAADNFERYTTMTDFESLNSVNATKTWQYNQVAEKAGPHSIVTMYDRFGKITKAFCIRIGAATPATDPALVTLSLGYDKPMKLEFDVKTDHTNTTISCLFREGTKPNWIYPLQKNSGTNTATAFGNIIPNFNMELNQWYHFTYLTAFDADTKVLTFSLWINGKQYFENKRISYAFYSSTDVCFDSMIIKLNVSNSSANATDSCVYWDNFDVHPLSDSFTDGIFSKNGKVITTLLGSAPGDKISFSVKPDVFFCDDLNLLLALYDKAGKMKQLQLQKFSFADVYSDTFSTSFTPEEALEVGDTLKGFVLDAKSLRPYAAISQLK